MSRIYCHTVMRVLAVPIALCITAADIILIVVAFPVLSILSLFPEKKK